MKRLNDSRIALRALAFVLALVLTARSARADFTFGTPTNLGSTVNSSSSEWPPSISGDGLSLFFCSDRPGGYGNRDIWVSTRPTVSDPWSDPVNLGPNVNSSSKEAFPSISADGLSLFFESTRSGGYGRHDLWVTKRPTTSEPWGAPVNLGPTVNSSYEDATPGISADGLSLLFESDRPGGYGDFDIWVTTRPTDSEPWGTPVNMGPTVNSPAWDGGPNISVDGLSLYFWSDRVGGHGRNDIWLTTRETIFEDWGTPVNPGSSLNTSSYDDPGSISPDGLLLYFESDRPGGEGSDDLWQAQIIPIVDFDDDGDVDCTEICIMTEFWGTNDSLCDIAPPPFGDGVVDVQDLLLLAEHLTAAVDPNTVAAPDPATAARLNFTFGEVSLNSTIPGIEAAYYETVGCFSYDGLEVYFTSPRPGGYGDFDLWVLRRASIDEDWGAPENLGPGVNSPTEDSLASISADGLTLYFESNRVGADYDIYATTRATTEDAWGQAVNLGPIVNSPHLDAEPWISPDGLELYFESYRPGGYGLSDIYVTRRPTTNDPWGTPENLGPVINSPYREQFLSLSPDGLILFFGETKWSPWRPGGYGGADMWMTRRASLSEPWQTPVNLGPKVNGPYNDNVPRISPDGRIFYFGSNRGGTSNCYQAPIIPNVDFDDDGDVDCTEICIMTKFWGTSDSLCDIAPVPFGDGVVDVQDLIVLAEHLFEGTPPTP